MFSRILACCVFICASTMGLFAFQASANSEAPSPTALVSKEFGSGFKVAPEHSVITGDFDGDGLEDAALVATGKNPLADEAGQNYKVIDPYNSYFGFGDPKITSGFISMQSGDPKYVLVIHSWRAATPKAKFVIINLPFEHISTGSFKVKKKVVAAITAEEAGGVAAAVYWDGKRYKWEAYGVN